MAAFESRYQSKIPNADGIVSYTEEENETWGILYKRQLELIQSRACDEFIQGVEILKLDANAIPQLPQVNEILYEKTGWGVSPVTALISHQAFFELLADRKFPAATFIRIREELNYIQEPDIFHELFGHCPMLTVPSFANFVQAYAEQVLDMPEEDWPLMQRLFWFTVEFGLVKTGNQLRAYGGGILSSIGETVFSVESDTPLRAMFNPVAVFRTPYRIDQMQPIYYVINSFEQLYQLVQAPLTEAIGKAREQGEFPPFFEVDENNPSIHVRAC